MPEPTRVLWHTDPSVGDPDDDYTAAVIKAMVDQGELDLVGVVVNRQPARERAEQFGSTLAALGLAREGRAVPVGIGADHIGRPMDPIMAGAPTNPAPPPVDGRELQRRTLDEAADGSLVVLVTTAATDLDWLMEQPGARDKIGRIVMMGDAVAAGDAGGSAGRVWVPGKAVNNLVDREAAARVYERVQSPEWADVKFTVVSRWPALAGGSVRPERLDQLAGDSTVAAWLRDRVAASINERWTAFNKGEIEGRDRATFVANHLGGVDPGRGADEPVFDLVDAVPIYDALVPIAVCHPEEFEPVVDQRAGNIEVIGLDREHPGLSNPDALNERLAGLLASGVGAPLPEAGEVTYMQGSAEVGDPQSGAAFAVEVEVASADLRAAVNNSIGNLVDRGVRGEPIECFMRVTIALGELEARAGDARVYFDNHWRIQNVVQSDPTVGGAIYLGIGNDARGAAADGDQSEPADAEPASVAVRTTGQILDLRLRAAQMRVERRKAALDTEPEREKLHEALRLAEEELVLAQREADSQKGLPVEPVWYEPSTTFALRRYATLLRSENPDLDEEAARAQAFQDERLRFEDWIERYGEPIDDEDEEY